MNNKKFFILTNIDLIDKMNKKKQENFNFQFQIRQAFQRTRKEYSIEADTNINVDGDTIQIKPTEKDLFKFKNDFNSFCDGLFLSESKVSRFFKAELKKRTSHKFSSHENYKILKESLNNDKINLILQKVYSDDKLNNLIYYGIMHSDFEYEIDSENFYIIDEMLYDLISKSRHYLLNDVNEIIFNKRAERVYDFTFAENGDLIITLKNEYQIVGVYSEEPEYNDEDLNTDLEFLIEDLIFGKLYNNFFNVEYNKLTKETFYEILPKDLIKFKVDFIKYKINQLILCEELKRFFKIVILTDL